MIRRPRRTLAASVVALALLVACVLVAVSCVQILLGRASLLPVADLARTGASLSGDSVAVLIGSAVVALAGLVLVVVAVRPGNPTVLALGNSGTAIRTGIARRSLDRLLTEAATGVDGIAGARVRTRGWRSTVTARAAFGDPRELRTTLTDVLTTRLAGLDPVRPHRLRVTVARPNAARTTKET